MPKKYPRSDAARTTSRAKASTATTAAAPPATRVTIPQATAGGLENTLGLAALREEVKEHPERFDIDWVHVNTLVPSPFNPPVRTRDLDDIRPSIRERGVLEPLIVVDRDVLLQNSPQLSALLAPSGDRVIAAGHRRSECAREEDQPTVPIIVRNEFASALELTKIFLDENQGRTAISPVEEGAAYQRLVDEGMEYDEIVATIAGAGSKGNISKKISLKHLTPLGKDLLESGRITLSASYALVKLPNKEAQDRALTIAAEEVKEVAKKKRARHSLDTATDDNEPEKLPVTAAVERVKKEIEHTSELAQLREQLAAEGIPEIDPAALWGDDAVLYRLSPDELDIARSAGDVAGACIQGTRLVYYRKDVTPDRNESAAEQAAPVKQQPDDLSAPADAPTPSPVTRSNKTPPKSGQAKSDASAAAAPDSAQLEAEREHMRRIHAHADASEERKKACQRLIADFSSVRANKRNDLLLLLSVAVLAGKVDDAAWKLSDVGDWSSSTIRTRGDVDALISHDQGDTVRLGVVTGLAALEHQASQEEYASNRSWPPAVVHYIKSLVALGYHTLSEYESTKLG